MANSLSVVMNKLLAQGLLALRQQAIMPRLVNRQYEAMAGEKGSKITVPIPSAIASRAVVPGQTVPAGADLAPSAVEIALDQWYEAPFQMTDKDMMEAVAGTIPMQASEAIKSLANRVDSYILAKLYKRTYSVGGTAGTTPFATDLAAFKAARIAMNKELAPLDDRRVVLGPDAEGNALNLAIFLSAEQRGDQGGIINGEIGQKVGARWFMDQNVPTHTTAALSAGALTVNGVQAAGVGSTDGGRTGTVSLAKATNPHNLIEGDVLTIAGQTYTVLTAVTLAVGNTTVAIAPALRAATVGGEAVTVAVTHVPNLLFHRDAFAFATRPLAATIDGLGAQIVSAVDPVSGLSLRLEVSRQYKQTTWSYDILYGGETVRPEFSARIYG